MKIFVDLDGVLVAFEEGVRSLGPEASAGLDPDAPQQAKDAMYKAITEAGPDWWANLAWTQDGHELWDGLKQYNPTILSSPGKDAKFLTVAEEGKKTWLARELPEAPYFLYNDKYDFAERDAMLIDDMQDNVDAWIQCGGVGITHKDAPSTLRLLSVAMNDGTVDASVTAFVGTPRDITITKPALFGRDLEHIVDYMKGMPDPKAIEVAKWFGHLAQGARWNSREHQNWPLDAELQINMIKEAEPLKDSRPGELVRRLKALLSNRSYVDASEMALRVALNGIPESWHRDVQRIREHQPQDADRNLVRDRVEGLKAQAQDKVIKKPSLFLRDIGRILNHIRDMHDPKKHGLIQDFVAFQNDFRPAEAKLPATFQIEAYDKAGALSDSARLIEMLANLFSETYDLPMPQRRRSLAEAVRRLAMCLAQASTQR